MPSTRSSAATKCISEVPGFAKHTLTPPPTKVRTRLSAPFISIFSAPASPRPASHHSRRILPVSRERGKSERMHDTSPLADRSQPGILQFVNCTHYEEVTRPRLGPKHGMGRVTDRKNHVCGSHG